MQQEKEKFSTFFLSPSQRNKLNHSIIFVNTSIYFFPTNFFVYLFSCSREKKSAINPIILFEVKSPSAVDSGKLSQLLMCLIDNNIEHRAYHAAAIPHKEKMWSISY